MATIYVDDQPYQVDSSKNLLQACLSVGLDIPYFCWHPALGSVGACRQCAVKQFRDENDTQGQLVMACMTPVTEGMRISINDPEAREFRANVIEWLMMNHPHDCPVCDEGGECHLQDMTVMTGHHHRRFRFPKRTFRNQYLGPFLNHEMNRCIQCYRCVRFYRDYAGGRDLNVFAAHDHVYFGRHEDGVLENEFSGNLVEICPTGVFTDKTLQRHYTRKWDLQTAPSLCVHCGLGCNTIAGERYGQLRRILNRYNSQVNGYFLCDRGRFGYEFVNSGRRVRQPLLRLPGRGTAQPVPKEAVLEHLAPLLAEGQRVIGIGSPRASLEANFALCTLVGPERFYLGVSERDLHLTGMALQILREGPARTPSLREVELADAVFVMGEDVTNTAPRLALALRQSVRRKPMAIAAKLRLPEWHDAAVREATQREKGPLFIASLHATRLDDVATATYHAAPDDLARLGFAVAHLLNPEAPPVAGLAEDVRALAERIAQALREAERPLIVSGISSGSEAVLQAAANLAWACDGAALSLILPECNSLGLSLLGGQGLQAAFEAAQAGRVDTALLLENDLYRRASPEAVQGFLEACPHLIVIDHLVHPTLSQAEAVLPASTFAEGDGTLVSSEGRAQRFYQVFVPEGEVQESWRWLRDLMAAAGRPAASGWHSLDDVTAALAEAVPALQPITEIAPPASFRLVGQKIPRQSHRASGRTALRAHLSVHEPRPPEDPDSPLSFSMEGYEGRPPAALIPRFWAPGWNSVQSLNKFQSEVGGPLAGGDPGVRLIEPAAGQVVPFFGNAPAAFVPRQGEWLIVPLYHLFGSEDLSLLSPAIAERAPQPYLALNPEEGVSEGQEVELAVAGTVLHLPVKLMPTLPRGLAGLPVGWIGGVGTALPAWGRLKVRGGLPQGTRIT